MERSFQLCPFVRVNSLLFELHCKKNNERINERTKQNENMRKCQRMIEKREQSKKKENQHGTLWTIINEQYGPNVHV